MYDLQLTPEQIEFRDAVRAFTMERIHPAAIRSDRLEPFEKPLMGDLLAEASQMGLRTLALPEDAGGAGADALTTCIVLEELGAGDVDIAAALGETALIARLLHDNTPDDARRAAWLSRFVEDADCHLAFARHETGSAAGWSYPEPAGEGEALPTAKRDGDGWVIEGSFPFVANATIAQMFIVSTDSETFLVPRDTAGLDIDRQPRAIGEETDDGDPAIRWHHGTGAAVRFNKCRVSDDQRIAPDRANRPPLGEAYESARAIQMAAINIGLGRASYDAAVDYSGLRRQGGRNIIEHQAIATKIANMAMKLELARNMVWKAAWAEDHPGAASIAGEAELPLAVIARSYSAEAMHEVTLDAAECFGAMGVMRDMPLQKYVHDGLVFLHGDGNDITTRLRVSDAVAAHKRA